MFAISLTPICGLRASTPTGRGSLPRRVGAASRSGSRASWRQASGDREEQRDVVGEKVNKAVASCLLATSLFTAGAPTAYAIDMVIVDPSVKQYMDSRDESMRIKCKSMMDCDGDRREYAKAQAENFVRRNSGETPIAPDCKVEEACTSDILGAAIAGLNGLTTSEKLEKMGRNANAVNSTDYYFGGKD